MKNVTLTISEIIEMAWDDQVSFDAIFEITGLKEAEVIKVMRDNMKPSSFRIWRKRVTGRTLKHSKKSEYIQPILSEES
jgi:uncharacterized protein (TIGR03643 family)